MTALSDRAAGLASLLHVAAVQQLPEPFLAEVHAPCSDTAVGLHFTTLAALTEWATFLDQPITDHDTPTGVHYSVVGQRMSLRVRCVAVIRHGRTAA